jgi:uncharacterized protein YkwD
MARRQISTALLVAAVAAVMLTLFASGVAGAGETARSRLAGKTFRQAQPAVDGGVTIASSGYARKVLQIQNSVRRRHGLRRMRLSASLNRAARRHARSMVRRHYFGHFSPRGRNVVDRVAATRYGRGRHFAASENLYWWSRRKSPRAVVRAWLGSSVHRANVLNGSWHQFGVAVVRRSPFGRGGVTVVGVYGTH